MSSKQPVIINSNCFDFLRFFFAFNILLAHLCELSQSKSLLFLSHFSNSLIAVKGFFIMSGFLVAKSFANTSSLKEYFIKRCERILPAYIFIVLFSTIFLSLFSRYDFSEYFSDLDTYQYLGWNLLFLNFLHPCLPGLFDQNMICAVNGALWTLKVEAGFYIILPLIFYIVKKSQKPFLVLGILYLFSLGYCFLLDYLNQPLLAKQLPGYLSYFVTGIYLFLNFDYVMKSKKILLGLSGLVIIGYHFLGLHLDLIYPAAFGLFVIITAYNIPSLNNFGKFGDFTYGLYISHFPIIQLFRQYNLFEKFNPVIVAIGVILISVSFAVFSWFFIEKRFLMRFKKRDLKKIPFYAG